jgi:hypothetical protein
VLPVGLGRLLYAVELTPGARTHRIEHVGRFSKSIALWIALVGVGCAAIDLSELRDGAAAMACCAQTDYSCAGLQAPDDCCRHMGHAAAHPAPATLEKHRPLSSTMALPANVGPLTVVSLRPVAPVTAFTRPHDPPHLHPFALLI